MPAQAAPSNQTVNFSARLKNTTGAVVADGYYNVEFKLYTQNSGGTAVWTETYHDTNGTTEGGDNRIRVLNGYLSAKLGSLQSFDNVDWDGDLWMTMNIGGTTQTATVANITWDGEMTPRIQLSAVPYAMNANAVGGKSADELVQLGQGTQTDASDNDSIAINKTGAGNFINLQSSGADAFTLSNTGSITLGGIADQSISVGTATEGIGHNLTIAAGAGAQVGDNDGGNLVLQGGAASGLNANGGDVQIDAGAGVGTGSGGTLAIGTINASAITIGNETSTTTIAGDLRVDGFDTSDQTALTIGANNATSINLGQNTNIAGNATIASTTNTENAFQVQNSASAAVLSVSTDGGNSLTLGSGNNGIGHVGQATSGTYGDTAVGVQTSTITRATPAGHTIIGSLTTTYNAAAPLTVTDSKGNTYTVDSTTSDGSTVTNYVFSSRITTALAAGDTLTLTIDGTASRWAWNVQQYDNIVAASRVDATANNNGTGTTMTSGATATTSDTHELVFGSFGYTSSAQTITPGAGFSAAPAQDTGAGSNDRGTFTQWKFVNQTGAQTSTATSTASLDWTAAVVTYRTLGERGVAGSIGFSTGNGFTGSLNTSDLTADRTYTLPDEDGAICLQDSANCGFVQTDGTSAQDGSLWLTGGGTFGDSVNIQTTADATNALSVQNANGASQLNVDTANSRVTIGTSDATGTLLVLDSKTTEGDPAGSDGAMYYNTVAGKFRCYEDTAWKDCITPLPVSKIASTDTSNSTTTPIDVTDLDFALTADTKYYYKFVIMHEAAAETTGIGFGVTTPTNPVMSNWCANTTSTLASTTPGHWGSYCGVGDATATTTGAEGLGTTFTSTIEGYIETDTDAGNLKLRMKSESANATTVKAGSFGILQIVQ